MKTKGFTLIELIAVISLLLIMALIMVPSVVGNIEKSKEYAYNQMVRNIESVAKIYITNNRETIPNINVINAKIQISLQSLIDEGLIKGEVENPKTGEILDPGATDVTVCVIGKNDYYVSYEAIESCEARDFTPPVIAISGDNPYTVELGGSFTDPGATASDNKDESVTVASTGIVNTNISGTYTIAYNATDMAGNKAITTMRTVIVNTATEYRYRDWVVGGHNTTVCDTCNDTCTRTLYRWYKRSCDCTCTTHYCSGTGPQHTSYSITNGIYYNTTTCESACHQRSGSGNITCWDGMTGYIDVPHHVSGSGTCTKVYTSWSTSSAKPSESYNSSWYETTTQNYSCNPHDCNCQEVWTDTSDWGSWSAFSRTPITATDTRQVDTRVVTSQ